MWGPQRCSLSVRETQTQCPQIYCELEHSGNSFELQMFFQRRVFKLFSLRTPYFFIHC